MHAPADPHRATNAQPAPNEAPLAGVRVLELGRFISAPWAGQMLADMGADVIKIERPGTGDEIRLASPHLRDPEGQPTDLSAYFLGVNRNKRSITANLASAEGRDIVLRLADSADVLIENYKAGDLVQRGLGFEALAARNPRLVYCAITGYGQSGPLRDQPAFDSIFQALTGMMAATGQPDGQPGAGPIKFAPSINDLIAGYNAAFAVMGALLKRGLTGRGRFIDIAMLDCATAAMAHVAMQYQVSGQLPQRLGTGTQGGGPNGVFRCSDGELLISVANQGMFEQLCAVLGVPELAQEPAYASSAGRAQARYTLRAELEPRFLLHRRDDLQQRLAAAGLPVAPVLDVAEAWQHPQVLHRGLLVDLAHPRAGSVKLVGNPIRMGADADVPARLPPGVGEHNDEILMGELGLDGPAMAAMRAAGHI